VVANWIFDGVPPSGARHGGLAQAEVFDKDVDTFVREVLQNARDQKLPSSPTVRVRFLLEEIDGPALDEFLTSLDWVHLEPHLDAIGDAGYVTISPRVAEALALIRESGRLRLLRIDDFETHGLTGGEDDWDSNFNALCRHTLITAASRRESGGSFGLGKSVLWRFSGLSTVLFSSVPSDRPDSLRFFGRTLLAWHSTEGEEWEGSGWLGQPEERPSGRRAISVWGEEAQRLADGSRLARESGQTGTSILIVGFDDPAREQERSVSGLCEEIVESASRWFWPAIHSDSMSVSVEGFDASGQVFAKQVHPTDEVRPFLRAQTDDPVAEDRIADPGQVCERVLHLKVPAQKEGSQVAASPAVEAEAILRVRLAETGETLLPGTVALQRGTGMVISYMSPSRSGPTDQIFHATLRVGTAHGSSTADHAAEEFLRASEPVAHSEWTGTTDRIRAEYPWGAQKNLREFLDSISIAIREIFSEPDVDTSEGPEALRRFFPMPGVGGGSIAPEPFRLSGATGYLAPEGWVFGGTFSRSSSLQVPWRFRVSMLASREGGAVGESLVITDLIADLGIVTGPDEHGNWEVLAEPGVTRVRFDGRAAPFEGLPAAALSRMKVRLDVRTRPRIDA
jgi:hypothetical protein